MRYEDIVALFEVLNETSALQLFCNRFRIKESSLWIPDWSKRTTVGSTMADDGTGSLFSNDNSKLYDAPLAC